KKAGQWPAAAQWAAQWAAPQLCSLVEYLPTYGYTVARCANFQSASAGAELTFYSDRRNLSPQRRESLLLRAQSGTPTTHSYQRRSWSIVAKFAFQVSPAGCLLPPPRRRTR